MAARTIAALGVLVAVALVRGSAAAGAGVENPSKSVRDAVQWLRGVMHEKAIALKEEKEKAALQQRLLTRLQRRRAGDHRDHRQ